MVRTSDHAEHNSTSKSRAYVNSAKDMPGFLASSRAFSTVSLIFSFNTQACLSDLSLFSRVSGRPMRPGDDREPYLLTETGAPLSFKRCRVFKLSIEIRLDGDESPRELSRSTLLTRCGLPEASDSKIGRFSSWTPPDRAWNFERLQP